MNLPIIPDEICAIIPANNDEYGDGTILISTDGKEIFIKKSVKSIIKNIAQYYLIDLDALYKKYSILLNRKLLIPIPIKDNIVLIPFKTREHIVKGDRITGYINVFKINRQINYNDKIVLFNGKEIKIYNSQNTVLERLNYADQIIAYIYKNKIKNEKINIEELDEIVKEVCIKYLCEKC